MFFFAFCLLKQANNMMPFVATSNIIHRYVTVNYRGNANDEHGGLQFIPDIHRSYDPLQYPLIFPDGQDGWHCNLSHTVLQHINYQLMDRDGVVNPILYGKSLGQQFMVDQFAKVELSRLNYIENHQKELRAEVYSGAKDAMKKSDGEALKNVGKKVVILPSSFTSGSRYMHQQYLDSIALYQRFAHPHLFITMTFNPLWPEIQERLRPGETALDRPDLVARVFKLKKQQLIKDITSENIFGRAIARTHSIEFQKRGFPHMHIIVWLEGKSHLTETELNQIICAEIPDEEVDVEVMDGTSKKPVTKTITNPLFEAVSNFMLHGPCGTADSNLSCMRDGYCRYNFPKDYKSKTEMSEDGYPLYRRRSPEEGGNSIQKWRNNRRITYTNADVVPYNKYLLFKYNCHINVEYCHSVNAIKYHLKYINKGLDSATFTVDDANPSSDVSQDSNETETNEVQEYLNNRYVSPGEGCWRLRGNEVAGRKPSVSRLQIHLEGEQTVYFDADEKDQSMERIERSERTKLTSYFDLNARDEYARNLLYREIPEHYTWDQNSRKWKRRKRNPSGNEMLDMIGRIYSIHPAQIQLYALRLLLNHVRGATSYTDIRTVDGVVHESFQAAAIALNLVKNDFIWIECMKEANDTHTNINSLRKLFVSILVNCEVSDHRALYENFKTDLCSDFTYKYKREFPRHPLLSGLSSDDGEQHANDNNNTSSKKSWPLQQYAINSALILLQRLLKDQNKTMDEYGLPSPDIDKEHFVQNCLADQYTYDEDDLLPEQAKAFFEANYPKLNSDQKCVFERIKHLVENRSSDGKLIFLDAPGGTGKTFTLNVLISWMRMEGHEVATSATSGIAATLLYNGRTAHNRFKLPFHPHKESFCSVKKQSDDAKFLRSMGLAIIDEGPMLNKLCYEALHRTLVDLAPESDKKKKFGGKLILVSGDFRQLLPVIEKANRSKIVGHTLKHSSVLWDEDVITLQLRENMRVKNEIAQCPHNHDKLKAYEEWLLSLGEGRLRSHATIDNSNIIEIPTEMCVDTKEECVDSVFDDFERNIGNAEYFQSRIILAATNEIVNQVNDSMVERIPGDLHEFASIDTVGDIDSTTMFPTEFLNSLSLSGLPEHMLKLKKDTVVILLRNMDIKAGHCNGTRYLVKHIGKYRLVLHKLDCKEEDKNKVLILPRIPMRYGGQSFPFELTRLQFPLKIAFALTINRAQGQSAKKCGVLLPKNVWTHGQIYVAFSRCGNPECIFVWAEQSQFEEYKLDKTKKYVKNVVYREVI